MSESKHKHTPGPWRVEDGTTLIWGACNPNDMSSYGMGFPIAECRISPSASWAKGPSLDDGEANARLITAAPDLLAVLTSLFGKERADEKIGWRGLNPSHGDFFRCEFCEAEHLDCTLTDHDENCPITLGRAAILASTVQP